MASRTAFVRISIVAALLITFAIPSNAQKAKKFGVREDLPESNHPGV